MRKHLQRLALKPKSRTILKALLRNAFKIVLDLFDRKLLKAVSHYETSFGILIMKTKKIKIKF
ncbi:MAG: hypothetical protein AUK48_04055 [Oscillatoriales cyanobacterium CG2_30_44_21]|nr:MAG: hypothetical protein AUK48_04055 [Oscillatoriales cyanobacterium CG2_30_44_21]